VSALCEQGLSRSRQRQFTLRRRAPDNERFEAGYPLNPMLTAVVYQGSHRLPSCSSSAAHSHEL